MEINQATTRTIVNFFVTIFVIVVILTVLLLLSYYLTPNNYVIQLFDNSKYNLVKEYRITIKPGTNMTIPSSESNNNFLKFSSIVNLNIIPENLNVSEDEKLNEKLNEKSNEKSNEMNLLIKNIIKSQSIIYNYNELIRTSFGSTIIIPNQSDNEIEIMVLVYNSIID